MELEHSPVPVLHSTVLGFQSCSCRVGSGPSVGLWRWPSVWLNFSPGVCPLELVVVSLAAAGSTVALLNLFI